MPCLVHLVLDQAFVRLLFQRLFRQLEVVLKQPTRLLQRELAAAGAGVSELKGPARQTACTLAVGLHVLKAVLDGLLDGLVGDLPERASGGIAALMRSNAPRPF